MAFSRTFIFIFVSAIVAVIVLTSSLFTVSETEQAIVLQFGAVVPTAKKILRDALVQDVLTENTINTVWPPAPAD